MFHNIPPAMQARMRYLEHIDTRDRQDGTPRQQRLRQIPPETGQFIALLAASAPPGLILEIGASAGYSTLWLALACENRPALPAASQPTPIVTFEILPQKAALARQTFQAAGVERLVTLIEGDALEHLPGCDQIAFCFLDAEKEIYAACYEAIVPRLVRGGWLVADNAINHRETLQPLIDHALADWRVDALVAPIGKGLLLCRRA